MKLRVKGTRVTGSAKLGVRCVRFTGFDPNAKPELSSYVDRVVTEDDESSFNSSATGSNGSCDGSTSYTARRVPNS